MSASDKKNVLSLKGRQAITAGGLLALSDKDLIKMNPNLDVMTFGAELEISYDKEASIKETPMTLQEFKANKFEESSKFDFLRTNLSFAETPKYVKKFLKSFDMVPKFPIMPFPKEYIDLKDESTKVMINLLELHSKVLNKSFKITPLPLSKVILAYKEAAIVAKKIQNELRAISDDSYSHLVKRIIEADYGMRTLLSRAAYVDTLIEDENGDNWADKFRASLSLENAGRDYGKLDLADSLIIVKIDLDKYLALEIENIKKLQKSKDILFAKLSSIMHRIDEFTIVTLLRLWNAICSFFMNETDDHTRNVEGWFSTIKRDNLHPLDTIGLEQLKQQAIIHRGIDSVKGDGYFQYFTYDEKKLTNLLKKYNKTALSSQYKTYKDDVEKGMGVEEYVDKYYWKAFRGFVDYSEEDEDDGFNEELGTIEVEEEENPQESYYNEFRTHPDQNIDDGDDDGDDDGQYNQDRIVEDESIEPDGVEIVSAKVEGITEFFQWLDTRLAWIENTPGIITNKTTGMHVGIGTFESDKVDVLKLLLFVNEIKYLKDFSRETNKYTQPLKSEDSLLQGCIEMYEGNRGDTAAFIAHANEYLKRQDTKYYAVNLAKLGERGYVEFRIMGGENYHTKIQQIKRAVYHFAFALNVATDPTLFDREYKKMIAAAMIGYDKSKEKQIVGKIYVDPYLKGKFIKIVKTFSHNLQSFVKGRIYHPVELFSSILEDTLRLDTNEKDENFKRVISQLSVPRIGRLIIVLSYIHHSRQNLYVKDIILIRRHILKHLIENKIVLDEGPYFEKLVKYIRSQKPWIEQTRFEQVFNIKFYTLTKPIAKTAWIMFLLSGKKEYIAKMKKELYQDNVEKINV